MTSVAGRTILLVTLLLCLPVASASVGGVAAGSPADTGAAAGSLAAQGDDAETNETVRHRDPDAYDDDGDGDETERWLSGWLSDRLEESSYELSDGEYDLARDHVDEEYRERFDQYVEVADDVDDDDDESESNAYEEAQREQERLIDAVEEYNELKAEYEAAREAGDDERALELARELEALAEEIGDASQHVQEHFETISEDPEIDLSAANSSIEETNESIQSEQSTIREAEFVGTELTVTTADGSISAADPLVGSGSLQTADGEAIANEEIRLEVGQQELHVETDENGAFEFEYRPVFVPADAESVTVSYLPASDSVYFGSETSVPVSIEPVEPALSVSAVEPESAAYNESITLESTLSVDGTTIDTDVPLVATIDGTPLSTTGATATVPADVPAGDHELDVALAFDDRALESTETTTSLTVTETDPDLTFDAARTGDDEVAVNGSLTVDGDGIEDQPIRIQADGTELETLTTGTAGVFDGTASLPEEVAADDLQFVAVYDDEGTNLARTEAAVTVAAPGGTGGLPAWLWPALGVVAVGGLAAVGYWYRSRGERATDDGSSVVRRDDPVATTDDRSPDVARSRLSQAADQLSQGASDAAIQSSYAAVRGTLEDHVENAETLTHWEFYHRYRDTAGADVDSLRAVTEQYERVTFGPEGATSGDAEATLEQARTLCGLESEVDAPTAE
ncbi:hypothetical protein RBH26_19365 [Natronolimnohabitans sp. A-GB9]|uniref:hypothetical protein n=1 Tax=Natronolimnohabitans sp. A-GB9 TaxID=3069757 RepID=UPI0027B6A4CB|nr:hypothetical protein [Natronolimnohabitans sp. A-GB9]MDQ2052621.1 hypothetical protein [Natronolimnohabitans sp. A-GB9]